MSAEITATENGPLFVQGEVEIRDFDGRAVITPGDSIPLCRCGRSANKPFCDGSHVTAEFDGSLNPDNRSA